MQQFNVNKNCSISGSKSGTKNYNYDEQDFRLSPSRHQPIPNEQNILQTKNKLHGLIEELNGKLMTHFHAKQQQLLDQYKRQLINAQKQLTELKNTTNEDQIRTRMSERKLELEKQRQELIQTNMFFSNKCEQYKHKLTDLISQGQCLEKQIIFLEGQLERANSKKLNLMGELRCESTKKQKNIQLTTIKKKNLISNTQDNNYKNKILSNYHKTSSMHKISKSIINGNNNLNIVNKNNGNINAYQIRKDLLKNGFNDETNNHLNYNKNIRTNRIHSQIMQKTPLEQLFEKTVHEMRQKRKQKKMIPSLNGEQFTDFEKKTIMQEFLSKEEVKKKIYQIIFNDLDDNIKMYGNNNINQKKGGQKIKISFNDLDL